jgi:hypothetical protein
MYGALILLRQVFERKLFLTSFMKIVVLVSEHTHTHTDNILRQNVRNREERKDKGMKEGGLKC